MTEFRTGVAGFPVAHSLSPALQQAAGIALGRRVRTEAIATEDASMVCSLMETQFDALAITTPLKSSLMNLVDCLTPEAQRANAVNSVMMRDGELHGHCTDGVGLVDALQHEGGLHMQDCRVRLLGLGGAGRAIATALVEAGASVEVVVRRPEALPANVQEWGVSVRAQPEGIADVIINATSAGLARELPVWGLGGDLVEGGLAFDLSYGSVPTPWSVGWLGQGVRVFDGRVLLLWQARQQFAWWFDAWIPADELRGALS
jgi:shikimate dehydrogenase